MTIDAELHRLADEWALAAADEAEVELHAMDAQAAVVRAKQRSQTAREAYQRKLHEWQSGGSAAAAAEPWRDEPAWSDIYALAAKKKGKK